MRRHGSLSAVPLPTSGMGPAPAHAITAVAEQQQSLSSLIRQFRS